ncbi:MAG: hypothetical protein PUD24_01960 [Oscillospiraceae bacterium]|nr:hypothetical protein [Oscillospiraceae bacterium]
MGDCRNHKLPHHIPPFVTNITVGWGHPALRCYRNVLSVFSDSRKGCSYIMNDNGVN